jgi:high-affinity iron transporter
MQAELAASSLNPLSAHAEPQRKPLGFFLRLLLLVAGLGVGGVLVWQGITAKGAPDPTQPQTSPTVALFDIAVLVFREGLECVLVLSAITASMNGANQAHRRPIAVGAAAGFAATWITWFLVVGILSNLTESVPALQLQAATGLLAVVVLLVIMNWFFHKVYWGGWIGLHNRKKKALLGSSEISKASLAWGFGLLGFASLYREGFEVVLFLQTYRLKMGGGIVLGGALIGLLLSGIVAVLTFIAHRRLPYRRMLIFTGVMLGFVLLVMVGEQAQEMQLAHWIPTHTIKALADFTPDWAGVWFSVFPTVETLAAQALAALIVVGSYYAARRFTSKTPRTEEASKVEAGQAAAAALP